MSVTMLLNTSEETFARLRVLSDRLTQDFEDGQLVTAAASAGVIVGIMEATPVVKIRILSSRALGVGLLTAATACLANFTALDSGDLTEEQTLLVLSRAKVCVEQIATLLSQKSETSQEKNQ